MITIIHVAAVNYCVIIMAVTKLDLSDLRCIRQELHSVKEKWLDIGMELNQVSPAELRKIAENHKQDYSICLNLMLMQWLERGGASWKILCEALQSTTVNEPALCKQLQAKYCSGNTQFECKPSSRYLYRSICTHGFFMQRLTRVHIVQGNALHNLLIIG